MRTSMTAPPSSRYSEDILLTFKEAMLRQQSCTQTRAHPRADERRSTEGWAHRRSRVKVGQKEKTVNPNSGVAHVRQQIDQEYEAAQRGLHGLASGLARHDVINAKMRREAKHVLGLIATGQDQQAQSYLENDACWHFSAGGNAEEHKRIGEAATRAREDVL